MSDAEILATWEVRYSPKAVKQKKKLPRNIVPILAELNWDLEHKGPVQPEWPHYSSLQKGREVPSNAYHCHIKTGRPTYVVCWQVVNKTIKIIEIFYVGTHENTPY